MKALLALILTACLSACAGQNPSEAKPVAVPAALEQCVMDCETIHAGQIRACMRRPVTAGRSGMMFNRCIADSYDTLGVCYSGCEPEPSDAADPTL